MINTWKPHHKGERGNAENWNHRRQYATGTESRSRRKVGARHPERPQDADFEIVDIEDYKLPLLDEPAPPSMHQYSKPHTKVWSEKIASLDAYIFVTPEYNHATSAALKNAIDYLFHEWNNKAAGFVGYGGAGGLRAVENLRLVMGEIEIADVRAQVALSMFTDFENFTTFKPHEQHDKAVHLMADQVITWGGAPKALRAH
jgi:NAD(P)H-dependent FMN reductase